MTDSSGEPTTPLPSKSVLDEVIEQRRYFHKYPEVSFSEKETSSYLINRLHEMGLDIKPCPTETGAVAVLETGRPGKTVMLRADIDALPIQEQSGVDFHSSIDGRMHACGHDAHMAIMIGVARTLIDGVACHTTVGNISSDGAWNIVPRGVLVQGSVRTFNDSLREQALDRLRDLLRETQSEFEVSSNLDLVHGTVPLMNEPNVTRTVLEVGHELIGDRASLLGRPLTVSDDFAEFLTRIPGCYFMLGAKPEGEAPAAHHSPGFRIDEAALPVGVKVLAGAASRLASQ